MSLTGITVNGKPLAEYVAKTQPRKVRNKTFTNGISRNLKLPDRDEPDFTQWVLIKGVQYLRAAKEPFEMSGKSLKGALQYDPDTDKFKCHECGEWLEAYSGHSKSNKYKHPKAARYRLIHGLSPRTPLAGLRYRSRRRERSISANTVATLLSEKSRKAASIRRKSSKQRPSRTIESLNVKSNCPAQLPERLKLLASQLGRTPTGLEMQAAKIHFGTVRYLFGSMKKFVSFCGLEPREPSVPTDPYRITLDELIQGLVLYRKIHGKWPAQRDIAKSGFMHSATTYQKRFGGLPQAIAAAEKRAVL